MAAGDSLPQPKPCPLPWFMFLPALVTLWCSSGESSVVLDGTDPGARLPVFKSRLHHLHVLGELLNNSVPLCRHLQNEDTNKTSAVGLLSRGLSE